MLDGRPDAARAAVVCVACWNALADVAAGIASRAPPLDAVARHADPRGPLFRFDGNAGDNPEPWWYHELVALHALSSYAFLTADAAAHDVSRRAAAFHHAETQPDHATGQPWALHAFASDAEFTPTADLLLLVAGVGQRDVDVVSRLLLADASVWLSGGIGR